VLRPTPKHLQEEEPEEISRAFLGSGLVVALAGCTATPDDTEPPTSVEPTVSADASAFPTEPAAAFTTAAFAGHQRGLGVGRAGCGSPLYSV
jgi:hypothetical protein